MFSTSALLPLCSLIDSTKTLKGRYYLQFRDEIVETQGGEVAYSWSHG